MSKWHSQFTKEYDLELPFAGAGMGFFALPDLVVAVSEAGGLGVLGVAPEPPPRVQEMIRAVKARTSRPFGVDFIITETVFGPATTEEHIDLCVAERVPVVIFFWSLPPAAWVEKLKRAGSKVWMQIGSLAEAREAAAAGMDALIVQGTEAGGHNRSGGSLFSLLPVVVDAVAPVPVLAAGGIADGRGVAAALTLGAQAVWVGTRLIASREAYAHPEHKRRLVTAGPQDTVRTSIFGPEWPDAPLRVLRNRVVQEWAHCDDKTPPQPEPPQTIGQTVIAGQPYPMPKFSAILPTPDTTGDLDEMCLPTGEGVGLIRKIQPAAEIVHEMMEEARRLMRGSM
jgi:NAD(P)H-dependent flavin oxidoreductase YrpB (nitropropane dioxygenase family)